MTEAQPLLPVPLPPGQVSGFLWDYQAAVTGQWDKGPSPGQTVDTAPPFEGWYF